MTFTNRTKHTFHKWCSAVVLVTLIAGSFTPFINTQRVTPTAEAVTYFPLNNQRPKDFAIIRRGATWHVFAIWCDITAGCDAQRRGLMHLTSTDLKNWTEVGFVLPPDNGASWDSYDIWAPSIIERDGTYYMFYTGVQKNGSNTLVQKIGLATSTDLNSWTKSGSNPIFDCSGKAGLYYNTADNGDGAACRDPYVMWDQNEHQWVMYMSARRTGSTPANLMTVNIATSENLTTWQNYGFIAQTDDNITESAHVFLHNGTYYLVFTENGSGAKWIDYATSSNPYTGWTRIGDLPGVTQYEYASEEITLNGREFFADIGATNEELFFGEVSWSGATPTIQDLSYGSIGNAVWNDTDRDGVYDGTESGIDGVALQLYVDNGDNQLNVSTDQLYATTTAGDDPNTVGTQHGFYTFSNVIPGDYWLVINPTNYSTGQALAEYVATTTDTQLVTISDNQQDVARDIGFASHGLTWRMNGAEVTTGAGLSTSSGYVVPSPSSGGATWWDANYHFRKPITVSAQAQSLDTTKTVTVTTNLTTLVSASKLRADYHDLRVVYWNGSTNTELSTDIIDSSTLRFKVKAAISAGQSDAGYYLYYGNPDALVHPTEPAKVYSYYSSFNSPDGTTYGTWTESGGSNWQITDNKWRQSVTTTGDRFSRDTGTQINLGEDWAEETTLTIADTGTAKVGGVTFHSTQPFGEEAYWMNLYASSSKINFFHWAWSQTSLFPAEQTGITVSTGTPYVARFEYDYGSANYRTLRSYQNNVLRLVSTEIMSGPDADYDIWYQGGACPCTDKQAYFALNTYEGDVTFNDVKGWQLHDGTASLGAETSYQPAISSTVEATSATAFTTLTNFSAATIAQGGGVKFALSNDGGATWKYFDGSTWLPSNGSVGQTNNAQEITTNVASFPTGTGQFKWRATLTGASDTMPILERVGASVTLASVTAPVAVAAAPTISAVTIAAKTATAAIITWTTDTVSNSTVSFGLTTNYDQSVSVPDGVTVHTVTLSGLTPARIYHARVSSTNSDGQTTNGIDFIINTPSLYAIGPTVLAPLIDWSGIPTLIVFGVAKGTQTLRTFIDGRRFITTSTGGLATDTIPFVVRIELWRIGPGSHTLYVQSTDALGRKSLLQTPRTFTISQSDNVTTGVSLQSSYRVQAGDSLWTIAQRFLGDGHRWTEIQRLNITDHPSLSSAPSTIYVGWTLQLPPT